MDPVSLILSLPWIGPYIPYVTTAVTLCAVACIFMPAPRQTSGLYYMIYQIVNKVAGNMNHARNLSAPESRGIVGGPGAVSDPQMATSSVPVPAKT